MRSNAFRYILILPCLLLALCITACGGSDSSGQSGQSNQSGQPKQGDATKAGAVSPLSSAPRQSSYVVNVQVETVAPRNMRDILVLPGETEALSDVKLAAEHGGVVDWVGVTEGQTVRAGQEIARINLAALQAAQDRAKANLTLADEQLRRRRDLYARKVLSREELEEAERERTVAEATLREAEVNYAYGITTTPVAGVVNKVYVDPGEYVGEGDTVADIVNVSTLRIYVNVPETDVRFLAEGQQAAIRVDAYPDRDWTGTVDFVAWKADTATRTFRVRLVTDNADGRIRPGMIARVFFLRQALDNALTAPLFCVQDKGGERVLFVEKNGVAEARTVELGVIEGDRVQIVNGLHAGDRLIVVGFADVEDGTQVNVR